MSDFVPIWRKQLDEHRKLRAKRGLGNGGPWMEPLKDQFCAKYKLRGNQAKKITNELAAQVIACKSEAARRILLGMSK